MIRADTQGGGKMMLIAPQTSQEAAQKVTSVPITKDEPHTEVATDFELKDVEGGDSPSVHKSLSKDRPSSTAASSTFSSFRGT